MSVIVTLRLEGDPQKLEEMAAADPGRMSGIAERAKGHGVVAHRFYGSDGQILVVDEWPDEASFQAFWEETGDQIAPLMQGVGATGEPEVTFWRKLDSRDEVGWGA
jgi:hypothetical protein